MLLFSAVFAGIWCWLLLLVTASVGESKKTVLLAGGLTAGIALLAFLGKKYLRFVWEKERFWTSATVICLVLMAAGLLYAGLSLRVYPGWDFGAVYQGAV